MKRNGDEEKSALDSFWDIGSLLPRQNKSGARFSPRDTSAVELLLSRSGQTPESVSHERPPRGALPAAGERRKGGGLSCADTRERRPENLSEVLFSYEPEGSLLRSVTVSSWPYSYNFYDRFLQDAQKYFDVQGQECEFTPFFSYIPQYSQLTPRQRDWYLWWRDCVRRSHFPKTDISYVLLLVYEIINLPDRIPPGEGLPLLTDLWLAYRDSFPSLDKYLCEWLCDYCLINRLPPPLDRLDPILNKIFERASFREFYLAGARDGSENSAVALSRALVRFASSYNWRSSRALTSENRPLFRQHIPGAVSYLLENAGESALSGARPIPRTLSRDAYAASLCSYTAKRRLDIEYLSFTHSIELRAVVTAAVKYAENRIRAACGLKSRLKVPPLPDELLRPLDDYFDRELPVPARTIVRQNTKTAAFPPPRPDYERFYDAPFSGFNPERARQIEQSSWQVTRMLEASLEEVPESAATPNALESGKPGDDTAAAEFPPEAVTQPPAPEGNPPREDSDTGWAAFFAALDAREGLFLRLLRRGESAANAARAAAPGILPDTLADAVNEKAVAATGDILLEEADGEYVIIEEYWKEVVPHFEGGAEEKTHG